MLNPLGTKQAVPQTLRLVCCTVNEVEYCVDLTAVRSIGRTHQFGFQTTLEDHDAPAGAIGWIASQQNKFQVYDLASQFGHSSTDAPQNFHEGFVILVNAARPFGLRVDRVVGNIEVDPSQVASLPHIIEPTDDKIFKGVVKLKDKWLLYADALKLHRTKPASITYLHNEKAPAISSAPSPTQRNTTPQVMLFSPAEMRNSTEPQYPMVFGLSLMQVQEVSNLLPIIPVPKAPHYVFGVTNWRNVPVPIVDLQARLGLSQVPVKPNQIDPKSRMLIARAPSGLIGVPINPEVKAFPLPIPYQRNQQRLPLDQALVLGIFDLEGMPLVIPDLDATLTSNFAPQH